MRLLICTQKIDRNDPILGFFHGWVERLAREVESIEILCLEKGSNDLPKNVRVYSLGKESGPSRLKYLFNFYKLIFKLRNKYDTVFVHMNPEYVVLGGVFWKFMNKKIALWYTHREVDLKLRVAEKFANIIFTASKESFRLKSNKLKIMGHGIDLKNFECPEYVPHDGPLTILQVGRITRIKHIEESIKAVTDLKNSWSREVFLRIVGEPATRDDEIYLDELKRLAEANNVSSEIKFVGNVSNREMHREYDDTDITLNLTPTGGVDKVVLESMTSGRLTLSSNQTFRDYFGPYVEDLLLKNYKAESVASAIKNIFEGDNTSEITRFLKQTARERADVGVLMKNIIKELQ